MKMKLVKTWSVISTVLVIIIVLFAIFLMGSRLMGFRVFNVISGSMSPTFGVGDLIYVKSVDPSEIKVGDPITFVLNEDLVVATHRVVRIDEENSHFYTKGDANETIDSSPVHYKNVIGVPQFSIPLLGYVSDFIQNPPGMYITIGICGILIFIVFLPDIIRWRRNKKERTANAALEGSAGGAGAVSGDGVNSAEGTAKDEASVSTVKSTEDVQEAKAVKSPETAQESAGTQTDKAPEEQ